MVITILVVIFAFVSLFKRNIKSLPPPNSIRTGAGHKLQVKFPFNRTEISDDNNSSLPGITDNEPRKSPINNIVKNRRLNEIIRKKGKNAGLKDIVPFPVRHENKEFVHPHHLIEELIRICKYKDYREGLSISVKDLQKKNLRIYPIHNDSISKDEFVVPDERAKKIKKYIKKIVRKIRKNGANRTVYYGSLNPDDAFKTPEFSGSERQVFEAYVTELYQTGLMPTASNLGVYGHLPYFEFVKGLIPDRDIKTCMILGDGNCRYFSPALVHFDAVFIVDDNNNYIKWMKFFKDTFTSIYPEMNYDERAAIIQIKPDKIDLPRGIIDFCFWGFDERGKTSPPWSVGSKIQSGDWQRIYGKSLYKVLKEPTKKKNGGVVLIDGFNDDNIVNFINRYDNLFYPGLVLGDKQALHPDLSNIPLIYYKPRINEQRKLNSDKGRKEYISLVRKILKKRGIETDKLDLK